MIRVAISQPRYLPAISYLQRIFLCDIFVFLDDCQHQRRAYEHRNQVRDGKDKHWLSIPLSRTKTSRPLINQLTVSDPSWAQDHKRKLSHYYSESKYFDQQIIDKLYPDTLSESRNFVFICQTQIKIIFEILKIDLTTRLVKASDFKTESVGSKHLADICSGLNADRYVSGINGRFYLEKEHFGKVRIDYHSYKYPEYRQQGPDYFPWMSWIDMYFNKGLKFTADQVVNWKQFIIRG